MARPWAPIAIARRALFVGSLLLLLPATGCFVEVSLDDKRCGDGHDCVPGYVCLDGVCVDEADAPPLGDAGHDGGPPDAGKQDGGSDDAGVTDAGHDGGGASDAGEDAGALEDAGDDDGGPGIDAGDEEDGGLDAGPSVDGGHDAGDGDAGDGDAGDGDAGTEPLFGTGRDGPLDVDTSTPINVCRSIVSTGASSVTLSSATGISAGMVVMLWQVQDTFATVADESVVESAGSAGAVEIVRVSARQGNTLVTEPAPTQVYESGDGKKAQACTVPEHTSVVIRDGGALVASAWNGSVGGIVALFASEGVLIEEGGRIDASARGFRGGLTDFGSNDGDGITDEITSPELGGQKGEGLDPTAVGLYGRGNFANGGGGGNAHNAGGGGGGNGGRGGFGGYEWADVDQLPVLATAGRPGAPVGIGVFSFGGGGGAAEVHHTGGVDGGRGGGAIVLFTPLLAGGGVIRANGAAPAGAGEAGSGGGAGGAILLFAPLVSGFTGSIEARGGDGGSAEATLGPGGGGGGGAVHLFAAVANVDVRGGEGGLTDDDKPRGATPGEDGIVVPLGAEP